jgi:hypothetical protein
METTAPATAVSGVATIAQYIRTKAAYQVWPPLLLGIEAAGGNNVGIAIVGDPIELVCLFVILTSLMGHRQK